MAKIKIHAGQYFGNTMLTVEREAEALILSSGQAYVENPEYQGSTWTISMGLFTPVSETISKSGLNNAFASLREMLGQDVKTLEFK